MANLLSNNNELCVIKKQLPTCLLIRITVIVTIRKSKEEWPLMPILQIRIRRFNLDLLCLFNIFVPDNLYMLHNPHIQKTSISMLCEDRSTNKIFYKTPLNTPFIPDKKRYKNSCRHSRYCYCCCRHS